MKSKNHYIRTIREAEPKFANRRKLAASCMLRCSTAQVNRFHAFITL
jgi:hypothetical protein